MLNLNHISLQKLNLPEIKVLKVCYICQLKDVRIQMNVVKTMEKRWCRFTQL